jgi:polyphenol oxidase
LTPTVFWRKALRANGISPSLEDRLLANLPLLAKLRLQRLGVHNISESGHCTVREHTLFYSHRRENGKTGRFASLIWRELTKTFVNASSDKSRSE